MIWETLPGPLPYWIHEYACSQAGKGRTSGVRDMDVGHWTLKKVIGGLSRGRDARKEIGRRLAGPGG